MRCSSLNQLRYYTQAITFAVATVALAACTSSTSPAPPPPAGAALNNALLADLNSYLSTRSAIEHISTLSMSISFRGDPSRIDMAVGTTQYGGGSPVTTTSLFQTGSNTKAFTSAIILKLEAHGILSITDTVGKWLPQYPAYGTVTLQQLLNMTSGIPTYDATSAWETDVSNNPYVEWTPAQLVAYVYPTINTSSPAWSYSNTGYILLQMIIDKASPLHSYQAELNALIADRGLQNTFYQPYFYPPAVQNRVVSGYEVNSDDTGLSRLFGQDTSRFSLGWAQAAGGMVSTPADLVIWVRELFEGNVLPAQQQAELTSLVAIPSGEPIDGTSGGNPQGFGLGLFQITDPLGLFWGYQGSTIGYRAAYAYFPGSGLIICIFTNSQAPAAESTVNTVLFKTIYGTLQSFGKV